MYKIIIKDEFGNEVDVCEAPKEFVEMVLNHRIEERCKVLEVKE